MNSNFLSKFLKGLLSTGLGTLFTIILGFLNITIAVRMISKEQFGTYLLLQVVIYALLMLTDAGLNISATRTIACATEKTKPSIVNSTIFVKFLIVTTIIILIVIAGPYVLQLAMLNELVDYIIPLAVLFALESTFACNYAIMQGLQNYKKLGLSQIALSVLNLLLMVSILHLYNNGIYALIYARQLSLAITVVYQYLAMQIKISSRCDTETIKTLIKFGYPLGLNNILTFVFMRIDTLLIGALLNPISVAYYGTASKIPDAGRQMFESFRSVYFPNVAELFDHDKKRDAEKVLNNSIRAITFFTTLCLLVVYLFQNEIVTLLFTDQYLECAPIMSLMMFAMVVSLIGYTLGTSLVAAGHSKLPVVINIVDTSVVLISNLLMIPKLGITGAAYASILARMVSLPVNIFFLKRCDIRVRSIEYLKPLCIFFVCLLGSLILPAGVIFSIMILTLYVVLCAIFSVITRNDYAYLVKGLKIQQVTSGT